MGNNKRVIILVAIALVLAITAITLSAIDSDIPTTDQVPSSPTGAVIGIEIQSTPVEDKLVEEGLQT